MKKFLPPDIGIPEERIFFIPPAIDPLSTKNIDLPVSLSRTVLSEFGIDLERPLLTQVSRFDPWKDPMGVIRIYRRAKERVPNLQLALIGSMATDGPDAFIFTNLNGAGSLEVNAFQRLSSLILQKSIGEGFGLVVSEALWKGTPVIAGNTGGIPLQMTNDVGGFLADGEDDYVDRAVFLLDNPTEAHDIGCRGMKFVKDHFLVIRLLIDELKLFRSLVL